MSMLTNFNANKTNAVTAPKLINNFMQDKPATEKQIDKIIQLCKELKVKPMQVADLTMVEASNRINMLMTKLPVSTFQTWDIFNLIRLGILSKDLEDPKNMLEASNIIRKGNKIARAYFDSEESKIMTGNQFRTIYTSIYPLGDKDLNEFMVEYATTDMEQASNIIAQLRSETTSRFAHINDGLNLLLDSSRSIELDADKNSTHAELDQLQKGKLLKAINSLAGMEVDTDTVSCFDTAIKEAVTFVISCGYATEGSVKSLAESILSDADSIDEIVHEENVASVTKGATIQETVNKLANAKAKKSAPSAKNLKKAKLEAEIANLNKELSK